MWQTNPAGHSPAFEVLQHFNAGRHGRSNNVQYNRNRPKLDIFELLAAIATTERGRVYYLCPFIPTNDQFEIGDEHPETRALIVEHPTTKKRGYWHLDLDQHDLAGHNVWAVGARSGHSISDNQIKTSDCYDITRMYEPAREHKLETVFPTDHAAAHPPSEEVRHGISAGSQNLKACVVGG